MIFFRVTDPLWGESSSQWLIPLTGGQWWGALMLHYCDVIMGAIASQITGLAIVYSTVYSDADQHQSSASLAFVQGIHRGPVNSPHKWPVTRKMFTFDDVIMVFDVGLHTLLNKQSSSWLFETPFETFIWRHHDAHPVKKSNDHPNALANNMKNHIAPLICNMLYPKLSSMCYPVQLETLSPFYWTKYLTL